MATATRRKGTERAGFKQPRDGGENMRAGGPHTAVSNFTTEADSASGALVSRSHTGTALGVLESSGVGMELLGSESGKEAAGTAPTAPSTEGLSDVGTASFAEPERLLESVIGRDDRVQVHETDKHPYRVNASLLITARDGSQWLGTAWFISPRTLVTAGHCVYINASGIATRDGWVKSIQVMPGRNGATLPYGFATSTQFWSVKGWVDSGDENYDYGAIVIPTDLGTTVGTLGFASYADGELLGSVANVTGYPGDKPGGTLWYDTRTIAAVSPTKVHYELDTAGGQSGAAVYVIRDGERVAVAVHAYGGATPNSGTRISAAVSRNLSDWKA